MAYTIGSQKGKDIAANMKAGETYKCSDGSTWKKEKDGSVTVTTGGNTYKNAYTPTSSSSSSSSKSSSSSSSSSSKKTPVIGSAYVSTSDSTPSNTGGNSQYTAVNLGDTWDANTDYQAIINNAVKNGDYVTAAKAEQLRNQKITATGSPYETTNIYAGYLQPDYSIQGQNAMANNAPAQEVIDIYNNRYDKAVNTPGLEQYANDAIQQQMLDYILNKQAEENQQNAQDQFNQWLQEYEQNNPKEDYQSKYDPQIDAILNEILNRDDFSYNAMNDPLYQQYAKMYQREGDRAMRETLAEVASSAGGMNSYAITAAQQANNYYNSQLMDRIPELYQLAYDMYLNDKESKVQDLGILQNMDTTQYNRYRDTISDWYADKNFAYNAYQNAVQQGNLQTNFDYNAMLDTLNRNNEAYWKNKEWNYNDMWTNKEWNSQQEDKEYERNLYDQETAKEEVWKLIGLGVTPSADLIARAGMSETDVSLAVAAVKKEQAGKGTSSSGGSSPKSSSTGGDTTKEVKDDGEDYESDNGDDEEKLPYNSGEKRWDGSNNYQAIDEACRELFTYKGRDAALSYLKEALETGAVDITSYMVLLNKYRN